ncbi:MULTISPECIES: amino acid aminotransferase [unclassified Undibacterium]|uniref:amino acid aminotransferase n=1 Tax=unclassified Undibacterium TaxID=2630295 RepID=UPI002AC89F36|nr:MULTISPECIES: amino acid aminotransferase [unclassified Undibacterium]MEB0141008.1 amino acid aminotransferase [Undibacterium sp. CCC2.1]MEB0171949.1 amino acid aminotransferase [Undibacterium sp. CCC1.1]MEB0177951.1 amino acid aminotransferase [Undibacterium sp. CCC3.4]MEB0217187.1 amino acid aminotransferase [Undibacterium sp. 5I2]WPX43562.1 amino acid aminotransferase [Undibacterium sp. CCC3.4]
MTAATHSPLFSAIEMAPRDPILGITEGYNADQNPAKVNLGVGVYYDDNGKVPLLECVKQAEALMIAKFSPRTYLPIEGLAAYDKAVQELVFGADSAVITEKRAITAQAIGGTGALKLGADFLQRFSPQSQVWISDPSWENHRALFESAGFTVNTYPYYDAATRGVNFDGMLAALRAMPAGAIVLLHACCHNPTGADLTAAQWTEVIAVVVERGLIPFLDMAYQGFGDGIDADGEVVRRFAAAGGALFVSNSFSKSFSLYGERVGALSIVAADAAQASRVMSQLKRVIRTNYSNPPLHGGQVVATVLATPELRQLWEQELAAMRVRIRGMRETFVAELKKHAPAHDFDFVMRQRGMFSYSGLSKQQVESLRAENSIYAVDTGRICVAALNNKNIDYVIAAIAKVL